MNPDFKNYQSITLNGHFLKGRDILEFCAKSTSENLNNLGVFMRDWLNDDTQLEVKTSGSTGKPKLISVSKNKMLQSAAMTAEYFRFQKGQNALLCLPIQYIAGKMMVVRALFSALNLICTEPSSNPIDTLPKDTIVHFAPLVPLQLENAINTGQIRKILLGGAPVSTALQQKILQLPSEVYLGYGMTETLTHIAIKRLNGLEKSDYFKALPGVILDADEDNCLIIRTPFLEKEVHTHDVVELLKTKGFRWKGRIDNVINSGGIKLYPEEIEQKISPLIKNNFFVAGITDEKFGQKLCLFIEGEERGFSEPNLLKSISQNLGKYEKPKEIFFIDRFQYTISGKIQREKTVNSL